MKVQMLYLDNKLERKEIQMGEDWIKGYFVGFMFLGIGIGLLLGNVQAGTMIGMGLGFIAQKYFKK